MNNQSTDPPIEILLIEDNPADIRLTEEAMKEGKVNHKMNSVRDGVEAIDYLRREGTYANVPRPDLILLDLKLPRKDGREVLAETKQDPDLRRIPIVVLSTSSSDDDILQAYKLNANSYLTKPLDLDQFIQLVQGIESFWLNLAKLPPRVNRL